MVVGLMSGTSLDGVDAAVVSIKGNGFQTRWKLVAFDIFEYPKDVKSRLFHFMESDCWNANEFCRLNFWLGYFYAKVVKKICEKSKIALSQIDLIGSHGQTIRHLPEATNFAGMHITGTLQIGDPSVIAKQTGIPTVADFRPADMALGGQGAPLVSLIDYMLFRSARYNRGILNIGGISNITIVRANANPNEVFAFDVGPGNMILDGLAQQIFNLPMDMDGKIASEGKIHKKLLDELLNHPYLQLTPPKSTGREMFGKAYINELIVKAKTYQLNNSDVLATATAFVAACIRDAYKRFIAEKMLLNEIYVGGGGANNPILMSNLKEYLCPIHIRRSNEFGISADAKEAICFAILANETISGNAGNLPSVTGASQSTILGKICL